MRFDTAITNSEAMQAMLTFSKYASSTALDKKLVELIKIRASQMNRCAYCLDMHTRDALKLGESERRLHVVAAWRESGMFSEPERVALLFTETLTTISHSEVSMNSSLSCAAIFRNVKLWSSPW